MRESRCRRAAADLVPLLRANGAITEAQGWIAEENLTAIEDAGLFKLGVPPEFGGQPVTKADLVGVVEELARGCGATGWVMNIFLADIGLVRAFPADAQTEVFGGKSWRISGAVSPSGILTPTEGGYVLDGTWGFHSGCPGADWSLALARVTGPDDSDAMAFALVPMTAMTILDDWDVVGMAGSGSNSVRADGVFVPSHRVAPQAAVAGDAQFTSLGVHIGLARAAIEIFLEELPGKSITFSRYVDKRAAPITQRITAEAQLSVELARIATNALLDMADAAERSGRAATARDRSQMRLYKAHIAQLAREAVRLILAQSGASTLRRHLPLQRIWRDIEAIGLHAYNNVPLMLEDYGRHLVGADD